MMPAIPVELNGEQLLAHIDTGGPFIIMGPEKAESLGIETVQTGSGVANAQRTRVFSGLADEPRFPSRTLPIAELMGIALAAIEDVENPNRGWKLGREQVDRRAAA